ncbi:50S ribosome-binding GTPase, partial [Burkholderiales bacterium]|nr:50S ribosome-binding GTPase [Burkholderiales bacterium]
MPYIFIISAPSGAGKSSLIDGLIANYDSIKKSVSVTTRKPREGEKDGEQYIFTDEADFKKRLDKKEFLEHAH